jgi:hypothetical protein
VSEQATESVAYGKPQACETASFSHGCAQHPPRSYSDHDTQKRGVAGFGRDDIDDGSFGVEFRLQLAQSSRGLVPAVTLFSSLIYAFGAFSVMVFFFVFHRAQQ